MIIPLHIKVKLGVTNPFCEQLLTQGAIVSHILNLGLSYLLGVTIFTTWLNDARYVGLYLCYFYLLADIIGGSKG